MFALTAARSVGGRFEIPEAERASERVGECSKLVPSETDDDEVASHTHARNICRIVNGAEELDQPGNEASRLGEIILPDEPRAARADEERSGERIKFAKVAGLECETHLHE